MKHWFLFWVRTIWYWILDWMGTRIQYREYRGHGNIKHRRGWEIPGYGMYWYDPPIDGEAFLEDDNQ